MKVKVEVELKPCPFCGNTKLFVGDSDAIKNDDDHINFTVCCDFEQGGCGATCGYELTKAKAITKWNTRCKQ